MKHTLNIKSVIWSIIALFLCSLMFVRCGDDDDDNSNPTPVPKEIAWTAHVIDSSITDFMPISIDISDFDKDGDMDILIPLFNDDELVLYLNDRMEWEKSIIDAATNGPTFAFFGDDV